MNILIADDSFYQRKVLSDLVAELGHQAVAVGSGEELLENLPGAHMGDHSNCVPR